MADLALSGLSGVDTSAIVEQLMGLERQSKHRLGLRQSAIGSQQTALRDLKAKLEALKAAAADLHAPPTWAETQTSPSRPQSPRRGPVPVGMLGTLKWVGLGLATLVFRFFMSRHLRHREGEALGSRSWLTEIEQAVSLAALEAPGPRIRERRNYPAADVLASVSRLVGEVTAPEVRAAGEEVRRLMAAYRDKEDLIAIGAYRQGTDP